MIIVEGPDGAGKTTLCNKLAEDFFQQNIKVMDWDKEFGLTRDQMKEDPAKRYYHSLRLAYGGHPVPFIHDRFYFSSLIYGPIQQGNIQMSLEDSKLISRTILALGCPVIMCMPPKLVVVDNVRGEGHQMEGVREQIEDIYDAYLAVMHKAAYPWVLWYDYTEAMTNAGYFTYDEIRLRVEFYLKKRAERSF